MTRKILLAYDGSADAHSALVFAVELAHAFGAELHVLAVVRPPEVGDDVESQALIGRMKRRLQASLRAVRNRLAEDPLKMEYEIAVGQPAERIVTRAGEVGADHIVIGHRGHARIARWLAGSVARRVIDDAHCAVTVVKRQPKEIA